jgi:hypothetical protein
MSPDTWRPVAAPLRLDPSPCIRLACPLLPGCDKAREAKGAAPGCSLLGARGPGTALAKPIRPQRRRAA